MKFLLRILSVCLCMLVLTHLHAIPPPNPPVLNQIDVYNGSSVIPITTPITNIPINTTIKLYFDQKVFNIGGSPITGADVTSFITFSGGIIFTATIDATGKIITIVPTQNPQQLTSNTPYTVGIRANKFQNAAADPNAAQTVDFKTAIATVVTPPLTLDLCRNGVAKVLGDIIITEGSSASFGEGNGQTFEMNAPTGFNFVANVGNVTTTTSDISNTSILVTNNKITLTYDIDTNYGATLDIITIQGIQVVWVSGTISQDLKRTGGTAVQSANRVQSNITHATFSSTAPPTAPILTNYLLASGFALGTNLSPAFSVPNLSIARFYASDMTTLLHTSGIAPVSNLISVTPAQLGYTVNNVVATTTFYMTIITGTCESTKTGFTITVGSVPRIASITLFNANNISLPTNTETLPVATYKVPTNTSIFLDFNEPIFNTSAVALDNTIIPINIVTNTIFEFEEKATALAVTGAVATMVGQRVTITSPELKATTSYIVRLVVNTCQSGLTIRNAEQTIEFTTADAVTVTAPSLSLCRNGVPQTLGNIVITEGSNASFGEGTNQLFEMNAPTGFNFVAGVGSVATTGSDVSNANLFVTANKVTLVYSVNSSYANANTITIQNLQVIWVSGTAASTPLLRAVTSNANQANDGTPETYATFGSVVAPAAPVLPAAFTSGNLNVCSGFLPANATTFTVASGSTAKFYDATNTVIYTSGVSTGTIVVTLSNLGYNVGNNTILGSKQFYMSITNASVCESPKTPFTVTNNPNPIVTLINGATNFCQSDVVTFNAVGTSPVNYVFQLSQNNFATAPAGVTNVSTTSSYSPTLSAGTYQLRVIATDATTNCSGVSNTINFTVVASPPTVSFVWTNSTAYSDAPAAINLFDVSGVSPFGTFGGRVGTLFNQSGGVYSGAGVVAGKFYPNAAGVGTHIITYTYTSGACVASAIVTFTVFSNNNPILNLNTTYCIESGVSGILTPNLAVGGGTDAFEPNTYMGTGFYSTSTHKDEWFTFPNYFGFNPGVVWTPTGATEPLPSGGTRVLGSYTFDPNAPAVLALFGPSDSFVNVVLTIATFVPSVFPQPPSTLFCNYYTVTVRVYRVLATSMNVSLADAQVFCKSDANFVINPFINGVPPSGGTSTMEYKQGAAAFAPFATANTITPSTIPAGTYDMRFTYVSPQGCTESIQKTFTIRNNPTPAFSIRNASGVTIISSTCTNNVLIRLRGAAFTGIGTYNISKTPFSANYSADANGISATVVLLSDLTAGAGVYNITLTVTNGSCVGTTTVQTLTVVPVPVADFSFAPLVPLPIINTLSICETSNSLLLYPDIASLPAGSGYFNIKKTTGGAIGKNFVAGVSTFDPLVDFDANSGTGIGTYEIKYIYTTTTGGCVGTSATKLLSIIAKPDLSFNLSALEICRNPVMPNITLTQNWINQGANTFVPANGITRIYASNGVTLLQTLVGAAAYSFNPNTLTTSPTIVTEFKIEFQYTDGIGCVGVSPQRSFFVNPLPVPTIVFASTNIFCLGDGNNATFTVNATGGTVGIFDGTKGFITLRNAPSTPVTAANTTILSNGTNIFNPSSLGTAGVGEYFVDYNYIDTKSCTRTVTCPTRLILKFNTTPQFDFPVVSPSYAICETATSLTLTPSLLNTTEYGTDASITTSRGKYIITKGVNTWIVLGTNTFNPNTLLVNDVNGGAGTYTIKYEYTSALSCVGESTTKQLIINPKPILNFALSNVNICNYATKPIVTLTPTWTNQGSNTFIGGSGFFNIYASDGTTLLLPMPNGSNTIDLNIVAFAPLMTVVNANPTLVTEFKVEYRYIDSKGCLGISAQQSLFVNPLPLPTISFAGTNSFCLANGNVANFTVNATGINIPTFLPASGFITIRNNPASSPATPAYTEVLANGATSFNVGALLNNSRVGEYFVDYTYTDTKGCAVTVTCPTMLIHNFYSAPDFLFQGGATSYTICETATSLVLNPFLINTTSYGTDNSLVPASGNYLITKGAFSLILPGTTPLNPQTMLVNATGGGVGTYNIQYRYTSARNCYGEGFVRQLIINARPALDFSFLPTPAEVCNNPTRPLIQVVPSWTNATSAFLPSNGKLRIYTSGGTVPILTLIGNYTIDPNATAFSGLISASAITVFDVEFEYVDINNSNCVGISVRKSFQLNPLPVPTITFSSVSNFCLGDGVSATFNLGATGAGVTPFVPTNGTISLRSNNASAPATPAYTYTFAAGINSFNPSALVGISVGEYYVDYTYIDAKGCVLKVTCSTLLKLKALPAVSFKFPFGQDSYAICESVTNVVLVPSIANGNAYGSENILNISRGEYIFTKGAFSVSLFNTNTFDPRAFLVTAGGGTGVYTVSYKYTTALGCDGFSTTIIPLQPKAVVYLSFACAYF